MGSSAKRYRRMKSIQILHHLGLSESIRILWVSQMNWAMDVFAVVLLAQFPIVFTAVTDNNIGTILIVFTETPYGCFTRYFVLVDEM
jgi:hypothetical protein